MRTRAEQWKRKGRMISALLAAALSLNGSCDSRFEGNKPLETAGQALSGTYLPDEGDVAVSVYQTTGRRGFREIFTTPFTPHLYTNRAPIDVDAAEVRGTYRWLGVSMTDASCWILSRLAPEKSKLLYFEAGCPEQLYVKFKPAKNQKIHQMMFAPLELVDKGGDGEKKPVVEVRGATARGIQLTTKSIARIATSKPSWWDEAEGSAKGVVL